MNPSVAAVEEDTRAPVPASQRAFVDGHVHIYPDVRLSSVFTAIEQNVPIGRSSPEDARRCVLLLADPRRVDGFARLQRLGAIGARPVELPGWAVANTGDNHVELRRDGGLSATFLRGQQLVTEEGLEVLTADVRGSVAHGLGLRRTLDEVRLRGGWCTIAWGVGKWLGGRGRLVAEVVRDEAQSGDVLLGDNGGRPWCWYSVPQFVLAAERGMRIVPGSDPLPIRGDESRIGSYGARIELPSAEGASLGGLVRRALTDSPVPLIPRGRRVGAHRFMLNQFRMQAAGFRAKGQALRGTDTSRD